MDLLTEEHLLSIPRMELFEEWLKKGKQDRNAHLYRFVLAKFDLHDVTEDSERQMKNILASFSSKINSKWSTVAKSKERFLSKFKSWLDGENLQLSVYTAQPRPSTSSENVNPAGRPKINFEDSSYKTKKHRVDDLVKSRSVGELLTAAEVVSRSAGNRSQAKVIKSVGECPQKPNKSHNSSASVDSRQLSSDEALAYYIDSKSTTHTYKQTRKWSMKAGHYEYPSYHCLRKAKVACYPAEEHIHVTENRVEIELQALLDKTAERLVQSQGEVIGHLDPSSSLTLISKWGCDGSSGHSAYKQKFDNRNKDCRRFREHNTRKCSRAATNRDLLSMLLITSDPLINSLREIPKKKMDKFPSEVLKLLVAPSIEPRHSIPRMSSKSEDDYYFSDTTDDDESDNDN